MRIAFITAGAAGMYCGSCMRDNTLTAALNQLGHDALLIPTYTPIRTDEIDVSQGQIFYGGINVYLQDRSWFFRHSPRWLDWLLNRKSLLRWASKQAVSIDYADLAELTVSMLQGRDGRQSKELAKLVEWLKTEVRPEVVILTNALLSGLVPEVKRQLNVPVLVTLQGDDIFLEALPPEARKRCLEQIRKNDSAIAGYISTCKAYADFMAVYLGVDRAKIDVVYPGLNLKGHGGERSPNPVPTLGYFARICPEKGFHNLIDAFIHLRRKLNFAARLRVSGWLGPQNKPFYTQQVEKLKEANLEQDFEHVECPDHARKVLFLKSIDLLSVPTDYHEPKGLYILESLANGTPVVQPRHGSFPELLEATGGGLLVEPGDIPGLANGIAELLGNRERGHELGQRGQVKIQEHFTAQRMAEATVQLLNRYVQPSKTTMK
jgi:glycosyltransferase involved in cell wall biosynthesis